MKKKNKKQKNVMSFPSEKLGQDRETDKRTDAQTNDGGTIGLSAESGGPICTFFKFLHKDIFAHLNVPGFQIFQYLH